MQRYAFSAEGIPNIFEVKLPPSCENEPITQYDELQHFKLSYDALMTVFDDTKLHPQVVDFFVDLMNLYLIRREIKNWVPDTMFLKPSDTKFFILNKKEQPGIVDHVTRMQNGSDTNESRSECIQEMKKWFGRFKSSQIWLPYLLPLHFQIYISQDPKVSALKCFKI